MITPYSLSLSLSLSHSHSLSSLTQFWPRFFIVSFGSKLKKLVFCCFIIDAQYAQCFVSASWSAYEQETRRDRRGKKAFGRPFVLFSPCNTPPKADWQGRPCPSSGRFSRRNRRATSARLGGHVRHRETSCSDYRWLGKSKSHLSIVNVRSFPDLGPSFPELKSCRRPSLISATVKH